MQKIIIKVSYELDDFNYYQDSYIKNNIIEIKENLHESIKEYIKNNDFVDFTKSKDFDYIYKDNDKWEVKKVGYIYRTKHDINNKIKYWYAWVEILWEIKDFNF